MLAQGEVFGRLFVWIAISAACVFVGFLAAVWLRRWLTRPDDSSAGGFSLDELRRMRESGQLSDEEFKRARSLIASRWAKPSGDRPNRI